jgi:hypothetical protein
VHPARGLHHRLHRICRAVRQSDHVGAFHAERVEQHDAVRSFGCDRANPNDRAAAHIGDTAPVDHRDRSPPRTSPLFVPTPIPAITPAAQQPRDSGFA